jgi:hypothetical protein
LQAQKLPHRRLPHCNNNPPRRQNHYERSIATRKTNFQDEAGGKVAMADAEIEIFL